MRAQVAAHDRAQAGAQLVLGSIAVNSFLVVLKFAGGVFGHTYALIADGTESLLDILSSLLVWAGLRVAARPPDANHPFGHGRAEPLAALSVVAFIFVAAGVIAWHAIHLIVTPHQGPRWFTLILLPGVVAIKIWYARRIGRKNTASDSTVLRFEAWHHGFDAIASGAAFVGIAIAVIGGRGWEAADDWAALFACVIVVFNGLAMLRKALEEIMDAAVPANLENQVRAIAAEVPGVLALDKTRVRKSGLSHLVDIQVRVDGDLSVRDGHDIAHAVRDALLRSSLAVTDVSVHVEPMR